MKNLKKLKPYGSNPDNMKMEDILKREDAKTMEYADELKTRPEAKEEVEKISKNVQQDAEGHKEYPDNLKTNP